MELIAKKITVQKLEIDMIIPYRIPPDRGFYLKKIPEKKKYHKQKLVIQDLRVENDKFMVICMDHEWGLGE
jgi:hypothetical protein